jgi:hypothetical protein
MPLQNRVTPWGELIATPARGTLTGNRGVLHNDHKQIVRHHVGRRWILCVLNFRGWRRNVMTPNRWTELFFLDEASGLAAGHRPCAFCQRERYNIFRNYWACAHGPPPTGRYWTANAMDAIIHADRVEQCNRKRTSFAPFGALPDGAFFALAANGPALMTWRGSAFRWNMDGYVRADTPQSAQEVLLLTPIAVKRVLDAGYPLLLHQSVTQSHSPSEG